MSDCAYYRARATAHRMRAAAYRAEADAEKVNFADSPENRNSNIEHLMAMATQCLDHADFLDQLADAA